MNVIKRKDNKKSLLIKQIVECFLYFLFDFISQILYPVIYLDGFEKTNKKIRYIYPEIGLILSITETSGFSSYPLIGTIRRSTGSSQISLKRDFTLDFNGIAI
jgi:hypothetical protein